MGIKLIVTFLLSFAVQDVSSSGRFITTLLSYTEFQPLTSLGEACDSGLSLPCDRFYLIKISPEAQPTIRLETPVISESSFQRVPSFLVQMDTMTSVSYEFAIFDRDDGNPSPLRTQATSLGVVAVNGFDLDSTASPTTLSVNTSESFHGLTFRIEVECDNTFYGPRCDKKCVPKDGDNGHFRCGKDGEMVCKDGFKDTAQNCMVARSPCEISPCLNGGECFVSADNTAQCRCSPGLTGDFCNRRISACDCNPCSNGGTCVVANTPIGFACQCTFGWTGELCQEDFDECTLRTSCPFGVSCINTPGSYTCCIGLAGPTPTPSSVTRAPVTTSTTTPTPPQTAAVTASPQTLQPPQSTRPAAPRPQTTRPPATTTTTTTRAPTPSFTAPRFVIEEGTQSPRNFAQTTTTPTPAVTQPTTQLRFVTQQPSTRAVQVTNPTPAVTQPPTPLATQPSLIGQQKTQIPTTTSAPVNLPVQRAPDAHCGNPHTQLRTTLIQNLQSVLQQQIYQVKSINLQRVTTNPTAFATFVRNKCGVLIVARVFAAPLATQQTSCVIQEINYCLFTSPNNSESPRAPEARPSVPRRSRNQGTGGYTS